VAAAPGWLTEWADLCWFLALVALSGGTASVFYYFFFFGIMVASFRGGYLNGLRFTLASAALFMAVGFAVAPDDAGREFDRFMLRPTSLIFLGYMISFWGGAEQMLKRRLGLLKNLSQSSNPRFGVDQTVAAVLGQVRDYFRADACLLVGSEPAWGGYWMRRADARSAGRAPRAERVAGAVAESLLSLPPGAAALRDLGRRLSVRGDRASDPDDRVERQFGDDALITVPWPVRDGGESRLYVTSRSRNFSLSDLDFLCQVVEHVTPIVENIALTDRLATAAAEQERRKISRDLHDGAIQPYVGLKMGLETLCLKAKPDNPLLEDARELVRVAEAGLAELRRYTSGLRVGGSFSFSSPSCPPLQTAVCEYAREFGDLYAIRVEVESEGRAVVNDRLAAEAFQMVREGLSNVRRHTDSDWAVVRLASGGDALTIEIENEAPPTPPARSFKPRSIAERAEALGGAASVEQGGGVTLVRVRIPL
jgi:signal transduction histidine kinase